MYQKKRVFFKLAISMIGFGIVIGLLFPFFALAMGVSSQIALSLLFFILCILAGILVGAVNIVLARVIVRRQLKRLSTSMQSAEKHLREIVDEGKLATCSSSDCYLEIETDDEFGRSAESFNTLLQAFDESLRVENAFKTYNKITTSELDLEKLSNNALREIMAHIEASAGAILIIRKSELELIACKGILAPDKLIGNNNILDILKSKQQVIIDMPDSISIDGLVTAIRPRSVVAKPILFKDTVLGVMILASLNTYTLKTMNHLEVFIDTYALALNNALEHSQLQKLVALDPLTGIYNKKFGYTRFEEEFAASIRTGGAIGFIMFDIDFFKKVNDTYGHIAGDRVLIDVANMAKAVLRKHDVLMRYGGEEFAAVLPGASTHDTLVVADRLRELIENSYIPYGDNKISVTVSMGVVSYPDSDVKNPTSLIKYADDALYRAKDRGRNRVMVFDETIIEK